MKKLIIGKKQTGKSKYIIDFCNSCETNNHFIIVSTTQESYSLKKKFNKHEYIMIDNGRCECVGFNKTSTVLMDNINYIDKKNIEMALNLYDNCIMTLNLEVGNWYLALLYKNKNYIDDTSTEIRSIKKTVKREIEILNSFDEIIYL